MSIDGAPVSIPDQMLWKGCMISDVPNVIAVIGYTNASWTLGADVAAKTLTRLMARLKESGQRSVTPVVPRDNGMKQLPFMKMQSTYLLKARGNMPSAGDKYPWLQRGSYFGDIWDATYGSVTQDIVSASVCIGVPWSYPKLTPESFSRSGSTDANAVETAPSSNRRLVAKIRIRP